jgi:hypothetical protein
MPARSFSVENATEIDTQSNLVPSMVQVLRYGVVAMIYPFR